MKCYKSIFIFNLNAKLYCLENKYTHCYIIMIIFAISMPAS